MSVNKEKGNQQPTKTVGFRASKSLQDLILLKAKEKHTRPSLYLRDLVIQSLSGKSELVLAKSIATLNQNVSKLDRKFEYFLELFLFYVTHSFADHPEIPADKKEEIGRMAEKRRDQWLQLFNNEIFEKSAGHYQSVLADLMEVDDKK